MADREDWVDALMRLILSLDRLDSDTKDHAASPQESLQNMSVASGGIGGMFTQRQGWEAGESACMQVAQGGHADALDDHHRSTQIIRRMTRATSQSRLQPMATGIIALLPASA